MRHASDLMTPWPLCIDADEPVGRAAALLRLHAIRHLPVIDESGSLLGLIDDARATSHRQTTHTAGEMALPAQVVVEADEPLVDLLLALGRSWQDAAVVVDAQLRPVGLLTERDAARAAAALSDALPRHETTSTSELYAIQRTDSAADALQVMDTHAIRHVLVLDGEQLAGVISWSDLESSGALEGVHIVAEDMYAGRVVHTVPTGTPLGEVAKKMARLGIGCVPVVEQGRPVGMVTRTDVMETLRRYLEDHA